MFEYARIVETAICIAYLYLYFAEAVCLT